MLRLDSNDWLGDLYIRQLSLAARGLYVDLLAVMDQASGVLSFSQELVLARLGVQEHEYLACLAELEKFGMLPRDASGVLYSPELRRRETNRANGRKGGNPVLKAADNQQA
jgi:hypothetical protein